MVMHEIKMHEINEFLSGNGKIRYNWISYIHQLYMYNMSNIFKGLCEEVYAMGLAKEPDL